MSRDDDVRRNPKQSQNHDPNAQDPKHAPARVVIRNGRVLDPASNMDQIADVVIDAGVIASITPVQGDTANKPVRATTHDANTHDIDAHGMWIMPGLIDLHVHLREPGQEYKEDIASGSRAAVAGGFTTIVAMPNTDPVIDHAELVHYVMQRAAQVNLCRVLPTGAVTMGQKGQTLAPFAEMRRAGSVAFTDDGYPVDDARLLRSALEYVKDFDAPIMTHSECRDLSAGGHMHEGVVSTRLGLPGIPRISEDTAVARDLMLAEYTHSRLHVCHVSTAGAVALIRAAKQRGVRVTAEAAPHHFTLTHDAVNGYSTFAKMNPPLREESDRLAVIEGLKDGTLDAIATDHAPHSTVEKDVSFADAHCGIIGLQTALPLSLALWRQGHMPLLDVIARMTIGPARVLNLPYGTLKVGMPADVIMVDPNATWTLTAEHVLSKSKNSPFLQHTFQGSVQRVWRDGVAVFVA